MHQNFFWIIPLSSLIALGFALFFYRQMMRENEGTELMRKIADHVRKGALAYLHQQYKVVAIVFLVITAIFSFMAYGLEIQNHWVPFAFITGGFFSGLAGFFGMKTATNASARAAFAASKSLDHGLRVAFRSGAVMGLVVVGLGLLDISVWYAVLDHFIEADTESHKLMIITTTMLTFGMGASLQALFARVGGGIFTKAADVGADLVGKVEAGIPEDDPRNPATIADNVGDNVGDVAGMGADLYESYCGSILATAALGAAAYAGSDVQARAVLAPMLIGAVGTLLSILGVFSVRVREGASAKELLGALGKGINISSVLIVIASFGILKLLELPNAVGIWGSIVVGLLTGTIIGKATEYYTSQAYKPTQNIAEQAKTGPATVIIGGIGEGMLSTYVPVLTVVIGTILAYCFAAGSISFASDTIPHGLYGIGIAAVGMLSTLGITLATDAYGPIADNAGGNAEMSGLPPEVRKRTDALDSLGNPTAATGKGFAIGSAALTALALMASYVEELRIGLIHIGKNTLVWEVYGNKIEVPVRDASLIDFMKYFEVHLMNPKLLMGTFIGSMLCFVFCGLTMNAVGRAAGKMVDEVRRQFREIVGIMEGKTDPDYARCVQISTMAAQKEMMVPAIMAILAPVLVGLLFGVPGVMGLLGGALATGFSLAVFMANSGGSWDNAKKYIEEGHLGGKGSAAHKAAVIGDTVGDPFKDTSGPSLNILIKLMTMVSIVMAGFTLSYNIL
ncbi:MAG: sodium-translocating pyrophosphatase [Planctomycetes bacterium]|nr:sodium-translocating pyrophosphatase [Planctomycetota bacterium]